MKQFFISFFFILAVMILVIEIGTDHIIYASQNSTQIDMDNLMIPYENSLKYDEIQKAIDNMQINSPDGCCFHFKEYVTSLINGEKNFTPASILSDLTGICFTQLQYEKKTFLQLIAIAIIAAIFTTFTDVFKSSQIAETGFYVAYLLLFMLLTSTFCKITLIASKTLNQLLEFMRALLPTYFIGITFSTGSKTSMIFYESTLFLITLTDVLLIKIILPLINIYFILMLSNNIMKQDMLSKMAELLKTIISWSLKTLLSAVVGFNVIQGLIFPVSDQVKKSILLKSANALPGVGNTLSSISESVLSAGILIKNAIGVTGLVIILSICFVPILKLALYQLIYKFATAIVQPVSDKRILNCINTTAQSAGLLMNTVVIGAILFLFTIVIITASTGISVGI